MPPGRLLEGFDDFSSRDAMGDADRNERKGRGEDFEKGRVVFMQIVVS